MLSDCNNYHDKASEVQNLVVLGSTGSIGVSTLDVVAQHVSKFTVFALAANSSVDTLFEQILQFRPCYAVLANTDSAAILRSRLSGLNIDTEVLEGEQALVDVAAAAEVDTVVAAIVGAVGLVPTMAAVSGGKRVLLANKESLVMAGGLFMQAVEDHNARLLPVDSEHNAIFQCLPQPFKGLEEAGVRRLLLTGSGGPFRTLAVSDLKAVTPEQACAHPNWNMGRKISVDSATMMNKGLEFIEACWLFSAKPEQIDIVIHPQSIVHSMVEYVDGSVLAQMGQPDMRIPIAHCLGWPDRLENNVDSLNFFELGSLDFCAPDFIRFPFLALSIEAIKSGGTMPAALNAANEVAVESFLSGRIVFTDIERLVSQVLEKWELTEPSSLHDVIQADQHARLMANTLLLAR